MELRYPVSLNPSATVFGLAFIEGGNTWMQFKNFDPFDIRRAAGVGVRVFLPMFGLLGLDYGWRFDEAPTPGVPRSQLHFIIGQSFN
jgi:outer membrane protein insertion porin family